jgi:hypothetical protein
MVPRSGRPDPGDADVLGRGPRPGVAAHQLGAAAGASVAGAIRTELGDYLVALVSGAALCLVAALITQAIRRPTATPAVGPA